jgi:alpha-N-arabinofuranosidase
VALPIDVRSTMYTLGAVSLPAVHASASRDKNGAMHLSLVNINPDSTQDVTVDIRGFLCTTVSGRILASVKIQDHNTFEDPDRVRPAGYSGARLEGTTLRTTLPPCSVVVLTLQ